jgi:hypothetical protein
MEPLDTADATPLNESNLRQASDATIVLLVGQVFESAPAVERSRMIEHLLRPLGVLSLMAVADGTFAKIRFRSGWQDLCVRLEDALNVGVSDVMALVDHAQQVSVETVDDLAHMLAGSAVLSSCAAAALLMSLLVQRAQRRAKIVGESGDR